MIFISKRFLARFGINNILKPRIINSRVVYNIKLNSNKNKIQEDFDQNLGIDFPSSRMSNDKEKIEKLVNKLKLQNNNK